VYTPQEVLEKPSEAFMRPKNSCQLSTTAREFREICKKYKLLLLLKIKIYILF
jgi:hypothetical protein